METVTVNVLRTTHHGELYLIKGEKGREIPADLAKQLAKGKKPAIEIVKGK